MKVTRNLISKAQKGFTLIELLIVIAILGVLAAAVLAALNPIEQINRGKDAGRISSVAQLGHAMESYYTSQTLTSYPNAATTWQDTLKTAGELQNQITAPAATAGNCVAANNENNFCYSPLNTGADATIWTILDSSANRTKANNCTGGTKVVAAVWIASLGKTGLDCLASNASVPAAGDTLY